MCTKGKAVKASTAFLHKAATEQKYTHLLFDTLVKNVAAKLQIYSFDFSIECY